MMAKAAAAGAGSKERRKESRFETSPAISKYRKIKISFLDERGIVARRRNLLEDSILDDPYMDRVD